MLYSIGNKIKQIKSIPHSTEYRAWKKKLSLAQLQAIEDELKLRVQGGDVHTSSWIPGKHWSDTPFKPIYAVACNCDEEAAAMCFGLILWEVMMRHPDKWSFLRCEKNGVTIKGLTYFRI
jgi:hypothetical protein